MLTKHPEEPLKSGDLADETVNLNCATTSIVTKWLVKSMVEHSLNMKNVLLTLRWLQNCVLPHPGVVQEVLGDEMLRNNIFKFYTRICEASSGTAGHLEELRLFSSIMLHLMDAQGLTNNSFHELVKMLCLSAMTEEEVNKKGNLSFLFHSHYKGEGLLVVPWGFSVNRTEVCLCLLVLITQQSEDFYLWWCGHVGW